jgi:hypothetical protein
MGEEVSGVFRVIEPKEFFDNSRKLSGTGVVIALTVVVAFFVRWCGSGGKTLAVTAS